MPERFKMSHAFHRSFDRFFINDLPLSESDEHAETRLHHLLEDFCLDLAHELDMDLSRLLRPHHMQLRVFFLDLTQIPQHSVHIAPVRQFDPVSEHRLQHRQVGCLFTADPLSRMRLLQPGHRTHAPRLHFLDQLIFLSGIDPDLIDLARNIRKNLLHLQGAPCHLKPGQPVPLAVA